MHFNTTDARVLHTVQTAEQVMQDNPEIGSILDDFDLLVDYRMHFKEWYGAMAIEYKLINALVNFLRLAKISGLSNNESLAAWIDAEPIRNALRQKVEHALKNPQVLTD